MRAETNYFTIERDQSVIIMSETTRYDVFLSHNSQDKPQVEQLACWLQEQGLRVWYDEWELRPGRPWQEKLEEGITHSGAVVVCVGPSGFGPWHEPEMRAALAKSVRQGTPVIPTLLPGCPARPKLPVFLEAYTWVDFRQGLKDEQARQKLRWGITGQKGDGTLSAPISGRLYGVPELPPNFLPRPEALDALKARVLTAETRPVGVTGAAQRVGVHGMGGIGKSVLAAALARDEELRPAFPDGIFWIVLGQTPSLVARQQQVAKTLSGKLEAFTDAQEGKARLQELLAQRTCLLILDDAWDMTPLSAFNVVGACSQLLVTTRNANLITGLGGEIYDLELLSPAQARELLAAWSQHPELSPPPERSRREKRSRRADDIITECGYLPLAIAMIGAMLRDADSDDDWEDALTLLREAELAEIEQAFPDYEHPNLFRALHVSVKALEPKLRERYLDFAVFPEDTPIPVKVMATFWSAAGLTRMRIKKLLRKFRDRSLLRWAEHDLLSLHDLQRDYVRSQAGETLPALHQRLLEAYAKTILESSAMESTCNVASIWDMSAAPQHVEATSQVDSTQRMVSLPWEHGPNDGYFFENLGYHLHAADAQAELQALLLHFPWLQAKLETCGVNALLSDYELLPQEGEIKLLRHTLHLSAHILAQDPAQLPSQLHGRLCTQTTPALTTLLSRARGPALWLRPTMCSLTPPGGALLRTLSGHTGPVRAVALTPDGRQVVSASWDKTLKVWELASGTELRALRGHTTWIKAAAVTPDGRQVVSASDDKTLKVWDLASGRLLATFCADGALECCAVAPDGVTIVAGDRGGMVHFLRLEHGERRGLRLSQDTFPPEQAPVP